MWSSSVESVRPPTVASPPLGENKPDSMEKVVVLPAPLWPSSAVIWPGKAAKLTSSTATTEPNTLRRPRARMPAAPLGSASKALGSRSEEEEDSEAEDEDEARSDLLVSPHQYDF